jgi:hypothetical protein
MWRLLMSFLFKRDICFFEAGAFYFLIFKLDYRITDWQLWVGLVATLLITNVGVDLYKATENYVNG